MPRQHTPQSSHAFLFCKLKSNNRQDLNSSILTGSTRRFNHTTFAELHWARDPFSPSFYLVPPGFQNYKDSSLSTADFTRVIEDLHALQCIRRLSGLERKDPLAMAYINNHTASIQSRLASLRSDNPVVRCCRLACYICSVRLCCTPWCALFVPVCLFTHRWYARLTNLDSGHVSNIFQASCWSKYKTAKVNPSGRRI